ncbi:hypothetical protein [Paracoccus marinaquae]|uniref:Uncharacterized protein n=1 Tax=Paracoccus marinaquae TaxID=2841926 RepID=A0ABS6AP68_9RHOB|nr:hypothetical protein [Paracoccus marinaquae]MBU3032400.1 hypothetical protein [Paracoccus marinaquae]
MSDAAIFRGLFLAWQRLTESYNASHAPDGSEAERRLSRQIHDLEDFAAQRPALSLEAFAFKVLIADDTGGYLNDTPGTRALVLESRAIAERMDRPEDSEILRLFRQREALRAAAAVYEAPGIEGKEIDAEFDALFYDACDELEKRMEAIPAMSPTDFAAKVITATVEGRLCLEWETDPLWQEARRLVA